ncbi:MAG TPA: HPr-rel-A system PqqD family peptide chaperone [Polyangiales bacterium]|jgi:PqqD family protein of HPr-rel-A system|nr:HPr-rel-A system PqqD family peptide chaperone [Polyangiales bacterium]
MNARLKDLAISDSGFVFDPFSGGTFTLNETGRAVLQGVRDGLTEPEIIDRLRADFDAVTPKVEEDVRDFLRTMTEYGLSD